MILRQARVCTLATVKDGQPLASLATPACAPDLSVLLFLSTLSEHTRQLKADPRCSLLLAAPARSANPQTAPRISVAGLAEIEPDPALKARWLAVHPYAQLYAEFTDFSLYRIRLQSGQLVGGFARAFKISKADLTPDLDAVARLLEAEAGIIAHCNADHADALALIAGRAGAWQMVAVDVDGFDLVDTNDQDPIVRRINWSAPVSDAAAVRKELVAMTRAAREQLSSHAT